MIVSFSVENFRSFKGEQTLSLVASKKLSSSHENHTVPIPDSNERVLRCAVLYGANGAGKSNLFRALRLFKDLAIDARPKGIGLIRAPFLFDENTDQRTTFDIQFIAEGKLYRFGIIFDDSEITEEWLAQIIGTKERVLYERKLVKGKMQARKRPALLAGPKLRALFTIGGPPNQTFLATARANLDRADRGENLNAVIRWFDRSLNTIAPDETFGPLGHTLSEDAGFLEFAGKFLKSASTGVDGLQVVKKELTEDELKQRIPEQVVTQILNSAVDPEDTRLMLVKDSDGQEFVIDRKGDRHIYQLAINSSHRDKRGHLVTLSLAEESDGTKRLLDFAPVIHGTKNGSTVFFVDEIDRSLHPILVYEFLSLFLSTCKANDNQQLLVTTHEANILNLDLLRRDEIWFAEKDKNGATHLYSLNDYKVRNDLEIKKHYLQGRFGAIPFLGNMQHLCSDEGSGDEQKAAATR